MKLAPFHRIRTLLTALDPSLEPHMVGGWLADLAGFSGPIDHVADWFMRVLPQAPEPIQQAAMKDLRIFIARIAGFESAETALSQDQINIVELHTILEARFKSFVVSTPPQVAPAS